VSTVKSPLADDAKKVTGETLQGALVDLVELSLVGKQAHWNLIGRNFRSIHLALDEVVLAGRTFADTVAERAIAIGVNPDGQTGALAKQSKVKPVEVGYVPVDKVITYVVDTLAPMISRFRDRMDATEQADPVTQDLFISIIAELEKTHWMFQAEQ
jgi:starvation-inducible DNA-binding protein